MTAILSSLRKSLTCVGVTISESFTLELYSLYGADKDEAVILH